MLLGLTVVVFIVFIIIKLASTMSSFLYYWEGMEAIGGCVVESEINGLENGAGIVELGHGREFLLDFLSGW